MDTGDCQTNMLANRDAEIAALRARVAELGAWAEKAEAVRVAAEDLCHDCGSEMRSANTPEGNIDRDRRGLLVGRMNAKLRACPPLGSVNACRHGEGKP